MLNYLFTPTNEAVHHLLIYSGFERYSLIDELIHTYESVTIAKCDEWCQLRLRSHESTATESVELFYLFSMLRKNIFCQGTSVFLPYSYLIVLWLRTSFLEDKLSHFSWTKNDKAIKCFSYMLRMPQYFRPIGLICSKVTI